MQVKLHMDEPKKKLKQHLETYTPTCIAIFKRFISKYEIMMKNETGRVECICEVFDEHKLALTFITCTDMANHSQVLEDCDEAFMAKHEFISHEYHAQYMAYLKQYIAKNDIDEDECDAYDSISEPIIIEWLSQCWLMANNDNNSDYNLFYFIHRYPNEPTINLVNQEKLSLYELNSDR